MERPRDALISPAVREIAQRLFDGDPVFKVSRMILGDARIWEWVHSAGYLLREEIAAQCPPLPPPKLRDIVADATPEMFLWTGFVDAETVADQIAWPPGPGARETSILDFGCGCGRVLRFFRNAPPPIRVVGADVNEDHVRWCREHLGPDAARSNRPEPPLPFRDSELDAVYSLSVFTHLGEDGCRRWMQELRRVLRPGGRLILTMHGDAVIEALRRNEDLRRMFRMSERSVEDTAARMAAGALCHRVYDADTLRTAKAGDAYGLTFARGARVEALLAGSGFRPLRHLPAGLRGWQDVYVAERV